MSKIDVYKEAKARAENISYNVERALGRDRSDNDKHRATCGFVKLVNDTWAPMLLSVDMSYGYYGSSSGYSATSENLGKYLAKAITKNLPALLDQAVAFAKADAEVARKAAEEEARSVLKETAS